MAAFELRNQEQERISDPCSQSPDLRRIREECIIALKVYDSCRQQDCLTEEQIGPARAAECVCIGDEHINEGDVIDPPSNDGGMKTL